MWIKFRARPNHCGFAIAVLFAWFTIHGKTLAQLAPHPPLAPGERMTVSVAVETATEQRFGSGFVATEHGYLVTSYRLVAGAKYVNVIFRDQTRWAVAGYVGMDVGSDLILLKLVKPRQLTAAPLKIAAQNSRVDDDIAAVSGPLGVVHPMNEQPDPPSSGKITLIPTSSELDELYDLGTIAKLGLDPNATWLRTSANVSGDYRGGPIFNAAGEVAGMTLWTPELDAEFSLAVPASDLAKLLKDAHPTLNSHARALNTLTIRPTKKPDPPVPPALPLALANVEGKEATMRLQQNIEIHKARIDRLLKIEDEALLYQEQLKTAQRELLAATNQLQSATQLVNELKSRIQAAKVRVKERSGKNKDDDDQSKERERYEETALSRELARGLPPLESEQRKASMAAQIVANRCADITLMQARLQAASRLYTVQGERGRGTLLLRLLEFPGLPVRNNAQEIAAELNDRLLQFVDRTHPVSYELTVARGLIYQQLEKTELARADFDVAAEQNLPVRVHALAARSYLRQVADDTDGSATDYRQAIAFDNKDPVVFVLHALACAATKDFVDAEKLLKLALPLALTRGYGEAEIQRFLALLYAACPDNKVRDSAKALKAAQRSCEITRWRNWACLDALAAAYAEGGQFDQALQWSQAAADLADEVNRQACLERRKLYEVGRPLRLEIAK